MVSGSIQSAPEHQIDPPEICYRGSTTAAECSKFYGFDLARFKNIGYTYNVIRVMIRLGPKSKNERQVHGHNIVIHAIERNIDAGKATE